MHGWMPEATETLAESGYRPHPLDFFDGGGTHYGIFPGCGTSIPFDEEEAGGSESGGCC